jgi:CTP:molybdopterin cytidylyltransferase MocA
MGAQKLLLDLGGRPLFARSVAAAAAYPRILVTRADVAPHVAPEPGLTVIVNASPERGMTHSLALADAAIADRHAALIVLLADVPLVDAALIARIVAARGDADVAYPVRDGTPGHPVVFGPRPRAALAGLPDGDTLRDLRADPSFSRVAVPEAFDEPYLDVDVPADYERIRARLETSASSENS